MVKKYTIAIPNTVNVFYDNTKNIIVIRGLLTQKSLKLDSKIFLEKTKTKVLRVSVITMKNQKKKLKEKQGTVVSLIKQLLIETNAIIHKKLNIIGVGYRVSNMDTFNNNVLFFRLGFSHQIYYKTPNELNIFCRKLTQLFLSGHSYYNITNSASIIRSKKIPDTYKGKGILFDDEKVFLKEGKKI